MRLVDTCIDKCRRWIQLLAAHKQHFYMRHFAFTSPGYLGTKLLANLYYIPEQILAIKKLIHIDIFIKGILIKG